MIKLVGVVRRRPEMTPEEFYRVWRSDVATLAVRLPGLRGYRQNHAVQGSRAWPWDGAAELWFDDVAAQKAAFASSEAAALAALEADLFAEVQWFLATEHVVMPLPDPPTEGTR
ncbi:EthD family reductase [Nocardioides humilatus]|uniref:EthD family reductase n=1 Tax=Nocardioides humilatus TaxID=2607660 RepID=A0A5B1LBA9_9ACTN|nr:EthD family reductase [Nocardioides humilatus]KAA1416969.1 EthD family reductase [Nocardioides humilatus]